MRPIPALLFALSALSLSAPAAAGPPSPAPLAPVCGSAEVDRATRELVERLLALQSERDGLAVQVPQERTVKVAFHVLHGSRWGKFPERRIRAQVQYLNQAFAGTGFRFELVRIDRTRNAAWSTDCAAHEAAIKKQLAFDPRRVMNVYVCRLSSANPNLAGIARYPWEQPEESPLHGILLNPIVLTGSGLPNYGVTGSTLVHEVGHYLGLWHTFEDGCRDGDFVADTPAQSGPQRLCQPETDTCPDEPGFDDVRNFMNYADDFCHDHFTPGQIERMHQVVSTAKPSL
jgi:hypothetical protein